MHGQKRLMNCSAILTLKLFRIAVNCTHAILPSPFIYHRIVIFQVFSQVKNYSHWQTVSGCSIMQQVLKWSRNKLTLVNLIK